MAGRGDLVTLETTDPNCGGVVDSRNRRWDRRSAQDGRIDVPRKEAETILRARHPETRMARGAWGGWDQADIWGPDGHFRRAPTETPERSGSE